MANRKKCSGFFAMQTLKKVRKSVKRFLILLFFILFDICYFICEKMFRSNQNITSRRFVSAPRLRRRSTLATTLRAVRGFAENKKDTIVQKNKPKVIDVFFRLYRQVRKVFAEQTGELLKRRSSLLNTQSTESVSWSTQGTSRNVHSLFLSAARSLRRFSQRNAE